MTIEVFVFLRKTVMLLVELCLILSLHLNLEDTLYEGLQK